MLLEQSGCVQLVQWRASKWTLAVVLGTRRLWCYWSNLDVRLVRWRVSKWPPAAVFGAEGCFSWRLCRYADYLFLQVAAVWMYLLYVEMCVESSFKGVMRLVLNAWCGYGEFLFNLQSCGYLWKIPLLPLPIAPSPLCGCSGKISLGWGRSPCFSMILLAS